MDWQQRIADATRYRDQTKGSYNTAKKETGKAQSAYDTAFSTVPSYQTVYEKAKLQNTDTQEISDMKNSWMQAKENTDTLKTMVDKLPESITQQFGGTGLTQAQRDMAKQHQYAELNKQFVQYNADYEVKFNDYNTVVDKAFDTSLDVANKNYDSYWDGVRRKFSDWQTSIKNQDQWEKMYYGSQSQLSNVQNQYSAWQTQQDIIRMEREFEQWQNDFAASQRNSAANAQKAAADYGVAQAKKSAQANARFAKDTALFQSGKLSTSEYLKRMDAGLYRS